MAKIDDKQKALADALHAAGFSRFADKSYASPTRDAQLNLEGRTHYVDDSTLRYFHSRVIYAGDHCHGLIYTIVESIALDQKNHSRGFRFVIFDIFGTIVERASIDGAYRTSAAARKAMYSALDTLDVMKHYRDAIASRRRTLQMESQQLTAVRKVTI
jgi:hypothetical protein